MRPIGATVSCTIQVTWNEKAVSINAQSQAEHDGHDVRADLHPVRDAVMHMPSIQTLGRYARGAGDSR
jgi:hypothetical protein